MFYIILRKNDVLTKNMDLIGIPHEKGWYFYERGKKSN